MNRKGNIGEFAVLAFAGDSVRGCLFRRRKGNYSVERSFIEKLDPANPAEGWKRGLKTLGRGKECPLYLTGALTGGIFFTCRSIELPQKAMREALEFELPQQMLRVPDDCRFQFVAGKADEEGNVPVNLYAIPGASLEHIAAMLTQGGGRADEFIYPLLGQGAGDPPVELPRIEADFRFADGEWQPRRGVMDNGPWGKSLGGIFRFPDDASFRFDDYLECLLTARLVIQPDFKAGERGLRILPKELKPKRFRNQLRLTGILLAALAGFYIWSMSGGWVNGYRAYREAVSERDSLKAENDRTQTALRRMEKELRELNRVVNLSAGEEDVVGKLALLTGLLPSNVLVSSLRWSEGSIDLILQTEAENFDAAALFRRIPGWKIGQLQQRRQGDTVNVITLKLVPAEGGAK